MKRQPYLPQDEDGIHKVLIALDTNLPGDLATKYSVSAADLLRLSHGRHAYGWFVDAKPIAQKWSQSITDAHAGMTDSSPAALADLPGLPTLPAVPTFTNAGTTVTAQMEPGFFTFLNRLVGGIKSHDAYDEADGILLKIVGAEIPPPDPNTIPEIKWKFSPEGCPILIVKKGVFQGFTVWAQRPGGSMMEIGFSTTREYELDHTALPMPAPGVTENWRVQVQYRYKNAPFGQKSAIAEIPVRGV